MLTAVDQLAGCPVPASALEPLVLAARVRDYEPSYLDELTASGEVLWAGHGALPGADGWVSLHLADQAPLTLPEPQPFEHSELHEAVLDALAPGGAWFFRQLATTVGVDGRRRAVGRALGAGLGRADQQRHAHAAPGPHPAGHPQPPQPPAPPRGCAMWRSTTGGRARMPARTGPPETAGRWALLPEIDTDPTRRAHATAERLLDRHGVVIRGAVVSERVPGGFAGRLQGALGLRGLRTLPSRLLRQRPRRRPVRHRRGGRPAAHLLRGVGPDDASKPTAVALAATDPANPFGAALPWPVRRARPSAASAEGGHRPGRKAGALVVLVDGELTLYVERGGRTLLTWSDDPDLLTPATACARRRRPPRLAGPADRGEGRRRVAARLRRDAPARGPPGRRLRVDPAGPAAEGVERCLRATPSSAPPGCSTAGSPARCWCAATSGCPQLATTDLSGATVTGTVSRGKHLLTRIDGRSGAGPCTRTSRWRASWRVYDAGGRWRRPAHQARVVLLTDRAEAVGFSLGIVELLPRDDEDDAVGHLGPDLLGPDWDEEEALRRLRRGPGPAARGGPARPDQARGHRQHVPGRAVLHQRCAPEDARSARCPT